MQQLQSSTEWGDNLTAYAMALRFELEIKFWMVDADQKKAIAHPALARITLPDHTLSGSLLHTGKQTHYMACFTLDEANMLGLSGVRIDTRDGPLVVMDQTMDGRCQFSSVLCILAATRAKLATIRNVITNPVENWAGLHDVTQSEMD